MEEWFLDTRVTRQFILDGKYEKLECEIEEPFKLTYVMMLLGLQLLLGPFIVRSRRNYKEGLLFTFAAISCLFIWIGWILAYFHFTEAYFKDISIVAGLVLTPTVLILVVFVPKVQICKIFL